MVINGRVDLAQVFISHSSKDNDLAAEVKDWLKADGHDVFLDYDRHDGIRDGEPWEDRLYEQLRAADAVLCIVTGDYVASQWCFGEIIAAKTLGSRIVPLMAKEGVRYPLLADLQDVAYHDATTQTQPRRENRSAGYCVRSTL
jgi:TIR domain